MNGRGITQQQLAAAVGITQASISRYLNGRTPKAKELFTLAEFFRVRADELIGTPDQSAMPIAKRLARLRIARQLTYRQLAELLELSESMIYQATRGDAQFSERALHRLTQMESRTFTDDSGTPNKAAYTLSKGEVTFNRPQTLTTSQLIKILAKIS
jgi:transcriptional regulator with XRE-family HTH domain